MDFLCVFFCLTNRCGVVDANCNAFFFFTLVFSTFVLSGVCSDSYLFWGKVSSINIQPFYIFIIVMQCSVVKWCT